MKNYETIISQLEAYKELGFKAEKNIDEMCLDAYNFVKKND